MKTKHPIVTCEKCGIKVEIVAVRGKVDVTCPKCGSVLLRLTLTTRKVVTVEER